MRLDLNLRGNGACPLCRRDSDCRLKKTLTEAVGSWDGAPEPSVEIVIYSCPSFDEKAQA